MRSSRNVLVLFLFVCGLILQFGNPSESKANPFFIEQFSVVRNGIQIFNDTFSDGLPPPSAPNFANGEPASYYVRGTLDELGGKVRLDTVGAAIVPGVGVDLDFYNEGAILLTNIDPLNFTLGLKSDDTFSVTGVYDLALPTSIREFYGIRLNDSTSTNPFNDQLNLGVQRSPAGELRIAFLRLDEVTNTSTLYGAALLDLNPHDQIFFKLERLSETSNAITASFAYIDGGVTGPMTTFGTTADIFTDENFTRADFVFWTPVPEPSTLLLLGSGLAGVAARLWRRHSRKQK